MQDERKAEGTALNKKALLPESLFLYWLGN